MRVLSTLTFLACAGVASGFLNLVKLPIPAEKPATKSAAKPAAPAKAPVPPVGGYVPAGMSRAQYAEILAKDAAKKAQRKEKRPVETLEEWQEEFEQGKTGHRFAKMQYDGWYKK